MLTGQPPYGNVPAFSRLAMVLHEEPARPRALEPAIPDGVEAVIQHAMARDPAVRTQSALELEAQLAAFDPALASPDPGVSAAAPPATANAAAPAGTGRMARAATAPSTRAQTLDGAPSNATLATDIVLRARLARPVAGFVAIASSLAAGAWIAALFAVIVAPSSGGEHALIGVIAIAAIVGVALLHVRMLRPSWRSAPAVIRQIRPAARALVAGVLTFGALELVAAGAIAVVGTPPLDLGARVIVTGLAAALGLAWQTLKLDDRLRRRIG
jgi:serine/threonine-protein kinase